MNIMLNGENFFFDKSLTIDELLKKNNISLQNIVIEINKEIITKSLWGKYELNSGDEVEIITAVGGG
ncbi:MAG: thiamine biosynthesis protein ThiS [Gammaproteobacteria bacterium]|nr:thiamine biosynthesis protein ThiS [Gammaproteobacteria bacterium]|tara:strand:- start:414 stop:614 length:201 start_codon:yes stop_codon:yes gene_type:complete